MPEKHELDPQDQSEYYVEQAAIDAAQNADPLHRAAAFVNAVLGADRVTVQTLNALGEYDIASFSPAEVMLAVNADE